MSSNMLTESRLIEMMRDEYRERLTEVMQETDMFDKRGNMIIRKGLKVRHKDTQYEYTVDDVTKDAEGEIIVKLKAPDQPRFSADPKGDEEVISGGVKKDVLQEVDPPPVSPHDSAVSPEDESPSADEVFVIDQEEFEKEYEVK